MGFLDDVFNEPDTASVILALRKLRQEEECLNFKASLIYITQPCLKTQSPRDVAECFTSVSTCHTKLGAVHAYNSSTWEVEEGGLEVQG